MIFGVMLSDREMVSVSEVLEERSELRPTRKKSPSQKLSSKISKT
jgi:hypothetical protein